MTNIDDLTKPARRRLSALTESERAILLQAAEQIVDALWPVLQVLIAERIAHSLNSQANGKLDDDHSPSPD